MRIDLNFGNIDSLQSEPTRRSGESQQRRLDKKQDSTVLSSGESKLYQLTAAALAQPEIRSDRVAELRAAVEAGSYSVEPATVADAILNSLS